MWSIYSIGCATVRHPVWGELRASRDAGAAIQLHIAPLPSPW